MSNARYMLAAVIVMAAGCLATEDTEAEQAADPGFTEDMEAGVAADPGFTEDMEAGVAAEPCGNDCACEPPGNPCMVRYCKLGVCTGGYAARGTLCGEGTTVGHCDGLGGCALCWTCQVCR